MPNIDVITSFTDCQWGWFLRNNLLKTQSKDNTLKFKCIINQKFNIDGWEVIFNEKSHRLAEAFNESYNYIDSEYVIYCHVDVALLMFNWDTAMMSYLSSSVPIVGCENPVREDKTCGLNRHFPSTYFTLCRSDVLLDIKPCWSSITTPKIDRPTETKVISKIILNQNESDIYNIKIGDGIKQDGGWDVPRFYKTKGYSGFPISWKMSDIVYDNFANKKIMRQFNKHKSVYIRDFVLNNNLLCSHFGRSHHFGFHRDLVQIWASGVNKYLETIS